MLFRRIAVRNFRKLSSPIVLDGLGEGVTIIAGDNEEGKSTLLDAIRAGLFERHNVRGMAADAMQPYGSSVRPEIQLKFELDGKTYAVEKGFCQKPSVCLITPSGKVEGPAAEEHLAELLRFKVSPKGGSKPDHQGILGLFWLEQGRALEGHTFGETGRSTLRASLEEEVGDVLGGTRGRKLLEAAKAKRNALLTTTGKPTGLLKKAINEADAAQERAGEYETKRQEYDRDIDELGRLRRELERIDRDRVLEKAQEDLIRAEKQLRAIEELRYQDEAAGQEVKLAAAQLENISNRWDRRQMLINQSAVLARALEASRAALADLEARTEDVTRQVDTASASLADKTAVKNNAETRLEKSRTRARVKALDDEIVKIRQGLTEAERLVAEREMAQDRLASIRIDKKLLEEIENLERAAGVARAAVDVIATRIRFFPNATQMIANDGKAILARQDVQVSELTRFDLEGFGAIEVAPGASELAQRRAELKEVEDLLKKTLAAAGVVTFAQAKEHFAVRTDAEARVNEAARLIKAYAPEGVDALRAKLKGRTAEREKLSQGLDLSLLEELADLEMEELALASAKDAEAAARVELDAARLAQHEHATAIAVSKTKAAAAEEDLGRAEKNLETARKEITDAGLAAELESARGIIASKERHKAETGRRLSAANPEEVELRLKRAKETLQNVEDERRRLHDQKIALENRLMALGQPGLGEHLDIARGEMDQAIARRDRLQAEANAWELLVTTLADAEREAKEAFLDPVIKRVEPFLRLLQPEMTVRLDEETLQIKGIARDGREEEF